MKRCLLKGYGPCRGKLSAEHYFSEALLRQLATGASVRVGGLSWQPQMTMQSIGIGSLTTKVMCEGHNNGLTRMDRAAGTLFRVLDAADKAPERAAPETSLSGPDVERWFLKALCGHEAAKDPRAIPDEWKDLLTGAPWPEFWGLYVADAGAPRILARELYMMTRVHPASGKILAANFSVAGVLFHLLLGRPDHPRAFGHLRPRGIIFNNYGREVRVEFRWPFETDVAIHYTKVATTGESPVHWADFKDERG